MPRFLLSFPFKLEDIVRAELEEKLRPNLIIEGDPDFHRRLLLNVDVPQVMVLPLLRSIDWFSEYVGAFRVGGGREGLRSIYEGVLKTEFPKSFSKLSSFRVTCRRQGEHDYGSSIEVQRAAGQAIVDKYGLKVDLEGFEINVLMELIEENCFISLLREEYVHGRYIIFTHPVPLKPSVAYGMVRIADIKPGMNVLDPMCGGGTIPIEVALSTDEVKIYGLDISEYFLEGAALNAEAMGVGDRILFRKVDCRKLSYILKFKVDRIITDPPYGTRPRKGINPLPLYNRFLLEMKKVLADDGRIVLITLMSDYMRKISSKIGLKPLHERNVKYGNTRPRIMVLTHD